MKRRIFLRNSVGGLSAFAGLGLVGLGNEGAEKKLGTGEGQNRSQVSAHEIGRPVRVVSISLKPGKPLDEVARVVDEQGSLGSDIIALPETFRGQGDGTEETLNGPAVTVLSALAKKHRTYIACPIDRKDGDRRFNSVVLLDRKGQPACIYNKVFPYWSEYDVRPAVEPGQDVPVYQADFGRVGFAICFDVNFPEVWQRLADQRAELVIWPSAYSAGNSLRAYALNWHYYIVSSTQTADCLVYDITGEKLHYSRSPEINVGRVTLDLDRCVFITDFNIPKKAKLLREHAADVTQEKWLALEEWFVLKAKRPGVSARQLAREYGLEELRNYIARSRREIDNRRGWKFAKRTVWNESNVS